MKGKIEKLVALCLVTVLVLSLSACGGNDGGGDVTTSENSEEDDAGGGVSKGEKKRLEDLGGMQVKIADWYYTEPDQTSDYAKDTAQYIQDIQNQYGFEITRTQEYAWQDQQSTYVNEVMSNAPRFHLYYLYQEFVAQPMLRGLMYDLNTVPTIDLAEEKWNPTVTELMTFGDSTYGMNIEAEPRGGLFFNKRMFTEAGIDPEEPYNLQAEGKWTWEKLEEYCKKLTKDFDSDGTPDQYAMASFNKHYLPLAAANNNAGFIQRNDDGTYYNATGSNEFMDAMNWAVGLIKDGYIMLEPEGASWEYFTVAFRDNDVAMTTSEVYQIGQFKNMEDDWGFVMFPYNQKNEKATNKTIPNDNIVVLPSSYSAEEAEKICFAYDLYTEPTPGYELDDIWIERYYTQFKDSRAIDETLTMMIEDEHKQPDYQPMIGSEADYGDFCYGVYALTNTPMQQVEQMKSKWDTLIAKMNDKYASFNEGVIDESAEVDSSGAQEENRE
jgi:ABC-type glycerol-3-phosphate transport system substrate-binding protein